MMMKTGTKSKFKQFIGWLIIPLIAITSFSIGDNTAVSQVSTEGTGVCCPEVGSTCVIGTVVDKRNYYKSEGSCNC
jgi:hypothetical protein